MKTMKQFDAVTMQQQREDVSPETRTHQRQKLLPFQNKKSLSKAKTHTDPRI